ncbi:MAG: hypothetical protein H6936_08625 [Burkholderiales bacterium]|nr:hypothetical protein [Burkholderiales bacterium]
MQCLWKRIVFGNVNNRDGGTKGRAGSAVKSDVAGLDGRVGVAIRDAFAKRPNFTDMTCSNGRTGHV